MRTRKALFKVLAVALTLAAMVMPGGGQTAMAAAGDHVMYIDGTSTITGYCQYEWRTQTVVRLDPNTGQMRAFTDPVRDELGIPQPTTLPPTCRDANPGQPGIQPVPCTLQRNLGPYAPYFRPADPTQGEVGLKPPCKGDISANTDLTGGCVDLTSGDLNCRINAPTWFYGYCGQTYGGAEGGQLRFQNQVWTIDRMGFPRGRGAWEFSGKISLSGQPSSKIRFYFAAAPNKPEESAACDTGGYLSQITFNGIAIVSTQLPVRVVRTKPGWHFCADDPVLGAGVSDGC